jgi:hypothetical protein
MVQAGGKTPRSRKNGIAAATWSSGILWLISKMRGASGGSFSA